jgi:transposase
VESKHLSNGKKKGENNRKNGNKYLSWAFVEAANFAIRYHDLIKRYYQRKRARSNRRISIFPVKQPSLRDEN